MWEYKVERYGHKVDNDNYACDFENFINSIAADGWELITAVSQIYSSNSLSDGPESFYCVDKVETDSIVLFFKRQR